jgi:peptidoglycan/LPS O-acetylase OafA/YrhL
VVWLALAAGILGFVGFQIAALFPIWLLGFGVSVMPLLLQRQHHAISAGLGLLQFALVNGFLRVHPVKTLYADTLLGLSFSFLLYCLVHLRTPVGSLLYQRIATGFSRFSYTLYVSHLPFLTFVTAILITPWHPWRKDAPHLLAAVLVVCVTYGYSFGLYLLFESNTDRVRRWINERLPEQHGRSTSIAAKNKEGRKIVG